MALRQRLFSRGTETLLLALVTLVAFAGFTVAQINLQLQQNTNPLSGLLRAWIPPGVLVTSLFAIHLLLRWRGVKAEQIVLPITGLLMAIGLIMLWRLRPPWAVWQQLTRGLVPGIVAVSLLIVYPALVERIRRDWPVLVSLTGLVLLLATAFAGVADETGARLALKIGPLPAIQTSEVVKLCLIIFLAWYLESEREAAQGRARRLG